MRASRGSWLSLVSGLRLAVLIGLAMCSLGAWAAEDPRKEAVRAAEVVVDRGAVNRGGGAEAPGGHRRVALVEQETRGGVEQLIAGRCASGLGAGALGRAVGRGCTGHAGMVDLGHSPK